MRHKERLHSGNAGRSSQLRLLSGLQRFQLHDWPIGDDRRWNCNGVVITYSKSHRGDGMKAAKWYAKKDIRVENVPEPSAPKDGRGKD